MTQPLIVTACGDPGGAGALVPVLQALTADGRVRLRNLAYRQGVDILQSGGMVMDAIASTANDRWFDELLRESGASLVLVATSFRTEEHEKALIAAAARAGIPSIAVLDFWANYGARFADASGRLCFVPDRVAAMDEAARAGLVADGIPAERIVVTGHPGFDAIARQRAAFSPQRRDEIRRALGTPPGAIQVLFASQPLGSLYGSDATASTYRGFHEQTVLDDVIAAMEMFARRERKTLSLVIRPHPREPVDAYRGRRSDLIHIVASKEGDARGCVMASDLVVGMTTMLLVEACYLGVPALSLQPDLRRPNMLPEKLVGLGIVRRQVDVADALTAALTAALAGTTTARPRLDPAPPQAAPAVAALVYAVLASRGEAHRT